MLGAIYTGIFDTHNTFDLSHVFLTGTAHGHRPRLLGFAANALT